MNIVEIHLANSAHPLPGAIPQLDELFETAMRQYLTKKQILEIYYFLLAKYKELPDRA